MIRLILRHKTIQIRDMRHKEAITVQMDKRLAKELRSVAKAFGNRVGMVLAAGGLMFLRADPRTQAEAMEMVFSTEVRDRMQEVLNSVLEERREKTFGQQKKP